MRQHTPTFFAVVVVLALTVIAGLPPMAHAANPDASNTSARFEPAAQEPVPPQQLPTTYPEVRKLYEAGNYQQVIDAVAAAPQPQSPPLIYIAGLAHEKLQQPVLANDRFGQLAVDRVETDFWRFIGESATALNQTPKNIEAAIVAARRAVELAPEDVHAHYQLGLSLSNNRDYAGASEEFARATEIDPAHAYAHYYAGMSFYQVQRIDQVAKHFEAFLTLAPEAPERGQVASIMRTIRD